MEDVETTLTELEHRLRALQADLDAEPEAPEAPPAPPVAPASDPLDRFGEDLRTTTANLIAAYDDALSQARGTVGSDAVLFSDDLALEAQADLPGLCALYRTLSSVPGVHTVDLRAYAGGHAALEVALDRPVALVEELERAGGIGVTVLEARLGRLAIEVR